MEVGTISKMLIDERKNLTKEFEIKKEQLYNETDLIVKNTINQRKNIISKENLDNLDKKLLQLIDEIQKLNEQIKQGKLNQIYLYKINSASLHFFDYCVTLKEYIFSNKFL